MKVSEKSLELNVGAEILDLMRNNLGMQKAYLRGLTQHEENPEGVDFYIHLDPTTRVYAFQFKAPKGRLEDAPYRYTLKKDQHSALFSLAQSPGGVFYVFPFYVTPAKLHQDVPHLAQNTWLLDINSTPTDEIFGAQETKVVRCQAGFAQINPEYKLRNLNDMQRLFFSGISVREFAEWYESHRGAGREPKTRRNPWLVRGLRVVLVAP